MDIDEFMDITKPLKRVNVSASRSTYMYAPVTDSIPSTSQYEEKLEEENMDYSKDLKLKYDYDMYFDSVHQRIRDYSDSDSDDNEQSNLNTVSFTRPTSGGPTITQHREEITRLIRENTVVIIKGATGCGKSTQVPQFILDEAKNRGEVCNVLVTQPRRIAAKSLATRVAYERKCVVGGEVGYQIGLEKETNAETQLLYCTTGVALKKLVKAKSMSQFTHIVLDEVHERDEEMEFLLIVVKIFLKTNQTTKVLLMSATFDSGEFSEYFRLMVRKNWKDPVVYSLPEEREFTIDKFYLDDMDFIIRNASIDYENPGIDPSFYSFIPSILKNFDNFDNPHKLPDATLHTVLIFLPGIIEIKELENVIKLKYSMVEIVLLHSSISSQEQKKVFTKTATGYRKVILATNIAESSITLVDIKYVIDFCLTKELEADNSTGFTTLNIFWASKNNCRQRAGRTGRTMNGQVYRLVSKDFFSKMLVSNKPALLRCNLEKIVLKAKILDLGYKPHEMIGLAIHSPPKKNIENAIMVLKEMRGLHLKDVETGIFVKDDGDLTFLGHVMEELPIDPRTAKLIVLGFAFSVMEDCIIIAAGLIVQKIWEIKNPQKLYDHKLNFAQGSGSDLIAILNAYRHWLQNVKQSRYRDVDTQRIACEQLCLDINGLNEMHAMVKEIEERLKRFKIFDNQKNVMSQKDRHIALKICIAGAFYPNYFTQKSISSSEFQERTMFHDLNGRDPCNTIYFKGIEPKYHPLLYQNQVKDFFRNNGVVAPNEEIKVSCDEGAAKIFVSFIGKQETIDDGSDTKKNIDWVPGRVKAQLYKAMKLSRETIKLRLKVCDDEMLHTYCEENKLDIDTLGKRVNDVTKYAELCALPTLSLSVMYGTVTFILHPNKFYFRPNIFPNIETYKAILFHLHKERLDETVDRQGIIGKIVAVKYLTKHQELLRAERFYQRAKVISSIKSVGGNKHQYRVLLIDEGEEITVDLSEMRCIDKIMIRPNAIGSRSTSMIKIADIPPRAYESTLAEIQPSYLKSNVGKWTTDAISTFAEMCFNKEKVNAKVYSVWNGIVALYLYVDDKNINQHLVDTQLAQKAEENFASKRDHANRYKFQLYQDPTVGPSTEFDQYLHEFYEKPVLCPKKEYLKKTITLRGPISPLETTIHSLTKAGSINKVKIDRQSVNCVLLDTDPQQPTERLIVATSISTSSQNQELTLRNSTIMPNIEGFASIMSILFGPIVEIHRDETKTRYTNALCGLGYENVGDCCRPYFSSHDLSINFDVTLNDKDMERINKLKNHINSLLHTMSTQTIPNLDSGTIFELQKKIKKDLFDLLQLKRKLVEVRPSSNEFSWGRFDSSELLYVKDAYLDRAILPQFEFMRLSPENPTDVEKLRDHNWNLYAIAFCNEPFNTEQQCLLCFKQLTSRAELQVHLFTRLHQQREEDTHSKFKIERYRKSSKNISSSYY